MMVEHRTHAHCLRNEQCACTYDLKTRWPPDGVQV